MKKKQIIENFFVLLYDFRLIVDKLHLIFLHPAKKNETRVSGFTLSDYS